MASEWSFRVRNARGKTQVIRLDPTTSVDQFITQTVAALGFRSKKNLSFRAGFPPRVVDLTCHLTVQEAFANNDTIVVDQNHSTAVSSSNSSSTAAASKPGRAHASKGKGKAKAPPKPKPRAVGIHTLHGKPTNCRSTLKRKDCGTGFVLGDSLDQPSEPSGSIAIAVADPAQKYRRVRNVGLNSKEDISVKLVTAVSGGAKDRVSKFFRAATKNAVEYQYAMTLANARLQAALGGKFEITPVTSSQRAGSDTSGSTQTVEIKVRFKEGVRKWKEEVVQLLEPMELRAILKYVLLSGGETGKEMLKPFNMAQCSTRVFWNVARLYDGDIERGLRELVPDENWAFLDVRSRKMSEKALQAKANREYEQQLKRQWKNEAQEVVEIDDESDQEQAAPSTHASRQDENDQEKMQHALDSAASQEQEEQELMRKAVARATLSRITMMQQVSASREPVAPAGNAVEENEEEEREPTISVICDKCNKVRIIPSAQASSAEVVEEDGSLQWTCQSLSRIGRKEGCDAVDDEIQEITGEVHGKCLATLGIRTRNQLANAKLHELSAKCQQTIPRSKLDEYVDQARAQQVDDLMLEILGEHAFELLHVLEKEKLGTPMDLVKTPSDLILRALMHRCAGSAISSSISENAIEDWQAKANRLVRELSWLEEWRSI